MILGKRFGARDDEFFPFLNEELFGTPESSKSQGSWGDELLVG